VKLEHLRAFIALRWKLKLRQFRRGGAANAIALGFLSLLIISAASMATVGLFFLGYLGLAKESPTVIMYVWDGLVIGFLFFWAVGLLSELQRSEALSLGKFLHLPVSPLGICLINYLSSLFSLGMAIFAPAMLALAIGLWVGRGPALLWLLPLVIAFLFMISALTYQFQGWLAALMINPRRRRTVIVLVTVAFIVLVQGPNLAQMYWQFDRRSFRPRPPAMGAREAGRIGIAEYERRQREYKRLQTETDEQRNREGLEADYKAYWYGTVLNLVLPPGWLPLGAFYSAAGSSMAALGATTGMSVVGLFSLWR
jgi:ABC-2 type transport system permease protein